MNVAPSMTKREMQLGGSEEGTLRTDALVEGGTALGVCVYVCIEDKIVPPSLSLLLCVCVCVQAYVGALHVHIRVYGMCLWYCESSLYISVYVFMCLTRQGAKLMCISPARTARTPMMAGVWGLDARVAVRR